MRGSRSVCGGGEGGGGWGPDPTEKSQNLGLQYWPRCPEKSQSYQASIQCWAIIGPPAKRYFKIGPRREKTCLRGFANNTGADQPAHPRSLISAFVIRFLKSTICRLATDEHSNF